MTAPVRVVTLLRRRDDLTHEEFVRHWRDRHGPLARALPGLLEYVQTEVQPDVPPWTAGAAGLPAVEPDGVAELAFASWADRDRAYASPAGQALMTDGASFIGASHSFVVARLTS